MRDVTDAYVEHVLSFIDVSKIRPYKIAIDAGNGMAGMIIPALIQAPAVRAGAAVLWSLTVSFPNNPASPIEPENTAELRRVGSQRAL